jgi:hypothetical protein
MRRKRGSSEQSTNSSPTPKSTSSSLSVEPGDDSTFTIVSGSSWDEVNCDFRASSLFSVRKQIAMAVEESLQSAPPNADEIIAKKVAKPLECMKATTPEAELVKPLKKKRKKNTKGPVYAVSRVLKKKKVILLP